MIFLESNGDLVLELLYNFLKITMDHFLKLMISDLTPPGGPSRTSPDENEVKSPTSYLLRSKSQKFYHKRCLKFDTIMEMSENQSDLDISGIDSSQEEKKSDLSFNKDLKEFKMDMIHQKPIHSSPKLVTSHFEDSGFLNYSIEMTSRLETISEIHSPQDDKSSGHEISFDSCLQRGEDHSHYWLKEEEISPINPSFIVKSGDPNSEEYSRKYLSDQSKPSDAEIKKNRDSGDGIEFCAAQNQKVTDDC